MSVLVKDRWTTNKIVNWCEWQWNGNVSCSRCSDNNHTAPQTRHKLIRSTLPQQPSLQEWGCSFSNCHTGTDSHRDINRLREMHIALRNYLLNHRDYFRARNRHDFRQQQQQYLYPRTIFQKCIKTRAFPHHLTAATFLICHLREQSFRPALKHEHSLTI